jgi:hypothetical protein
MDMTSSDRFEQRASLLRQQESPNQEPDRFSQRAQYLKDKNFLETQDENETERGVEHAIGVMIAHGLGQIAAFPGNVRDLALASGEQAQNIRKQFNKKLGLGWSEDYFDDKFKSETSEKIAAPFKFLINKLPNTQDVNEFIDEFAGGALAPKGEAEKLGNELSEDIVNSLINRAPKGIIRNFLIPGAGVIARKGLELLGAKPESQFMGKMLTNIGLDLASISNPRQMVANQINRSRRLIPQNEVMPINPRDIRFLDLLDRDLQSGGTAPYKTAALTKIQEMRDAIQNNQISVRQVHDFYRTMNGLKSDFGAFSVEGASKPRHAFNVNRVQNLTRNMLNRYGRNQNPRFLREFRESNAAWASLEQSDDIARYIKQNYNKPFVSEGVKAMFAKSNKAIPIAIGLSALERAQAVIQRLANPTLRRYYGNILRASTQRNAPLMISNLQKLDQASKKEEDQ